MKKSLDNCTLRSYVSTPHMLYMCLSCSFSSMVISGPRSSNTLLDSFPVSKQAVDCSCPAELQFVMMLVASLPCSGSLAHLGKSSAPLGEVSQPAS